MNFLKKFIWLLIIVAIIGALGKGAIHTRYLMTSNNYGDYWKRESLNSGQYVFIALGDSKALGVGASTPTNSYVGLLIKKISQTTGMNVKIINLSSSAGIDDVITRQIPKITEYKPEIITISVGSNEIETGMRKEEIIYKIQTLIENLPIEDIYIAEIPSYWDGKKDKIAQEVNQKIRELSEAKGIKVIPLHSATVKSSKDITTYDLDLSHPNDKGYSIWAETFWNSIQ